MIPQAQHRHRTDAKRSGGGIAPDRAVPRTICSGRRISGPAVDGKVPELYRRPDPAAVIGTVDRVTGGPGARGLLDDGVPPGGRCRVLGVFAHPDDETFCAGGTFARYAGQGAEIMVVSATRGQAGQIRDAAAGNRRTIAAVREAELRLACERLGVTKVRCLDHVDGTLADAGFPALVDEVTEVIREFGPEHCHHVRSRRRLRPSRPRHHQRGDHGRLPAGRRPRARPGPDGRPAPAPAAPAVLPALPAGRPADHRAAGDLAGQPAGPLRRDARLCPRFLAAGRGGQHPGPHPQPRPGPLVPAGFVRGRAGRGGRRAVLDLVR